MRITVLFVALLAAPLSAQGFSPELLGPPAQVDGLWAGMAFKFRDVNGDGLLDLLDYDSTDSLRYAPGHADGSFAPAFIVSMGPTTVLPGFEAADLDLDGLPDLLALNGPVLVVRRGLGEDAFGPLLAESTPVQSSNNSLVVADLDGDGLPDVLISRFKGGAGELDAAKGQGDGSFGAFGAVMQTRIGIDLQVADLDADGDLDVLEVNQQHQGLAILDAALVSFLNDGEGQFATGVEAAALTKDSQTDAAGDHDADGLPDVLAWDATSGAVTELSGLGDGLFEPHPILELGLQVWDAKAVDLDRDGSVDLALMEREGPGLPGQLVLQRLVRLVPYGDPLLVDPPSNNSWLGAADLDGDGLPELAVSADIGNIGVVLVYPNALGPVVDLGLGTSGGPTLAVSGLPAPGEELDVQIQTAGPVPALLVVGTQALPLPFKGALLVPDPLISLGLVAPTELSATWPEGLPAGTLVYLQAFVPAGSGLAGSQAVMLVPEP
jgi:FG-GAP-like repeat